MACKITLVDNLFKGDDGNPLFLSFQITNTTEFKVIKPFLLEAFPAYLIDFIEENLNDAPFKTNDDQYEIVVEIINVYE